MTPRSPKPGVSSTWVTSQWKYRPFPGQLSAAINTVCKHVADQRSGRTWRWASARSRRNPFRVSATRETLDGSGRSNSQGKVAITTGSARASPLGGNTAALPRRPWLKEAGHGRWVRGRRADAAKPAMVTELAHVGEEVAQRVDSARRLRRFNEVGIVPGPPGSRQLSQHRIESRQRQAGLVCKAPWPELACC